MLKIALMFIFTIIILLIEGQLTFSMGESENLIPRPEHPKPQFERGDWLNLNGRWNFAFDFDLSGIEKGWPGDPSDLDKIITVPFCPESKLSGIEYTDFIPAVWYHKKIKVPADWTNDRIFLHFGGVDYDCRVWVNGQLVGRHYGGAASFYFEITDALQDGNNDIVVYAIDDVHSGIQPLGKQSPEQKPSGIRYTRVTGIWQTVWLEARPNSFIESVRVIPDLDNGCFYVTPVFEKYHKGMHFKTTVYSDEGNRVMSVSSSSSGGVPVMIKLDQPRAWSPDDPYLYELKFELLEKNHVVDLIYSYAGLRKIHIKGNKIFLNNRPIFLSFVLDQGYYPDGIWTAPSDEMLKADIELSMAVGFNGARLHQKVFEERFHYWADQLGYLTWGEFCDWGLGEIHKIDKPASSQGIRNLQSEWLEVVMRDLNHPSIIAWTPHNETGDGARVNLELHRRAIQETVDLTRALDPTRPIHDASGHLHVDTDIYSVHDYDQEPELLRERYSSLALNDHKNVYVNDPDIAVPYSGQPYIVAEYGGTYWIDDFPQKDPIEKFSLANWGHGKNASLFLEHLESLTEIMTNNPNMAGFCYTQLYDVETEKNGIYTYDRRLKFNTDRLKEIFAAPGN